MRWLCLIALWATVAGAEDLTLTVPLIPAVSADVYAGIAERVQRVFVKEGDRIARGDTLTVLDDGTVRFTESAARVAYEKVRSRLKRAEKLEARGLISAQQLEDLRFDVEAARARWERAQKDLSQAVILAPLSGVIAECGVRAGDLTSIRGLLFRVIVPEDLKAELFIPADRLSGVRIGQPVSAHPASGPECTLEGRIIRLSPVIDPESGTCRAVALFPGAGRAVRPGTVARVQLGKESGKRH
ncbi:MAG: hypothetical protein A3F84_12020 [Candidatus Handelsmanbacteria bacterium RIFCSPLOWO2_12_FULL_64_10]|uniref:CusB-like beta-barrel domain-containing protein n=1 Tax=Handelsmanbacteria sp. (strain RIFCSPLOWO2_12_FULL_64_10) TaxID=1817868 RepID=A0A1F6CLR8_HANXR|nr:MAG: hypothetical protein A3F84_12020 [Candidatus Handelsmanbacteria bacterium RIFCSPLOWO2_12_FULL_64_10]